MTIDRRVIDTALLGAYEKHINVSKDVLKMLYFYGFRALFQRT
ncbi:hypothetical protein HMPREF5505_0886 [Lactobacillus delbrueckii subsp. lactis DSM 20072]|nr:hypothetical protein HMPREF5505_0886 [Lactobacillus delbrueckii subsp. lactis DSM 20072]